MGEIQQRLLSMRSMQDKQDYYIVNCFVKIRFLVSYSLYWFQLTWGFLICGEHTSLDCNKLIWEIQRDYQDLCLKMKELLVTLLLTSQSSRQSIAVDMHRWRCCGLASLSPCSTYKGKEQNTSLLTGVIAISALK